MFRLNKNNAGDFRIRGFSKFKLRIDMMDKSPFDIWERKKGKKWKSPTMSKSSTIELLALLRISTFGTH